MAEYIDREKLLECGFYHGVDNTTYWEKCDINSVPIADVVEIETLKAWLYEIAMNNVGCHVDDLASACEEIVSRLDGLRLLAGERRIDG